MRVKLIVTGDAEFRGLTSALKRMFPTDGSGNPVDYLEPGKVSSATSFQLQASAPPSRPMSDLARRLVNEALYGERGPPADFVIALDDLELGNIGQPHVVTDHLRRAVMAELSLAGSEATFARHAQTVRNRCSFHLLVPMLEAYFFGEHAAMVRAGCEDMVKPVLASQDVEEFETADPDWLPVCVRENAVRAAKAPWWRHERHPKYYLEHLVRRKDGSIYYETTGGVSALEVLDWRRVAAQSAALRFARSLFADFAEKLGVQDPLGEGTQAEETWPVRSARRENLTLRNL